MSEKISEVAKLPRTVKQLKSSAALSAYQKEWFHSIKKDGFGMCSADEAEEIFTAFDMPVVVIQWWMSIIAAKRMSPYYGNLLAERGYDMQHYQGSLGLASTIDNNPETAPWGGLPRPLVLIGNLPVIEIWAREWGCPCFPLDGGYRSGGPPTHVPDNWWETMKDHWEDYVEPHVLDLRVAQYKELIKFLEIRTGRSFSYTRLAEVNELINEQEGYWRKARDLIASTIPCPVSAPDQLSIYPAQWYRGTPAGRDFIKAFYEEVKERVGNGIGACPNEKIRLKFSGRLWGNTAFFQYFEEKYGAVFVDSTYTSIAADCLARKVNNNDHLRVLAGRHAMLGGGGNGHGVFAAKLHKCDGVIGFGEDDNRPSPQLEAYRKAGIPVCEIPGDPIDQRQWRDEYVREIVSRFIEKLLMEKYKKF
jgi:hypothetical protein